MNFKFHKMKSYAQKFTYFTCVYTIPVKFEIKFHGLPLEIVFGVITDNKLHL